MPPIWQNWTHQMGMSQQEVQTTLPNNKGSPLVTEKWVVDPGPKDPQRPNFSWNFTYFAMFIYMLANLTWPINFLSVAIVHIVFNS